MIQPAGLGGMPVGRPSLHGDGERVLDRLFGNVDVAEDADKDRHRAAVFRTEDPFDVGSIEHRHAAIRTAGWLVERPHFDRKPRVGRAGTIKRQHARQAAGPLERHIQVRHLDDQKPPRCSLPSTNGPSVTSLRPRLYCTTVAELAGCRPPVKTQTPALLASSIRARHLLHHRRQSCSGGGGGPSG